MSDDRDMRVTKEGGFTADMSDPQVVDLGAVRARMASRVEGTHAWVVGVIYAVDDPERALDDMSLGEHNLLGFQPIHCLWCGEPYSDIVADKRCEPA